MLGVLTLRAAYIIFIKRTVHYVEYKGFVFLLIPIKADVNQEGYMQRKRVFISSVQSEFSAERQMLFGYLTSDALLGKFFDPFIFENVPALSDSPSNVFLNQVEKCDIYLGIFGQNYGYEDADGISPTEREFDIAVAQNKTHLVYVKQVDWRHPKEELLIRKAEQMVVRRSFVTLEQLKTAVYVSLINYLMENEIIRTTPFDATLNNEAALDDLDEEKIRRFIYIANKKRAFPFEREADIRAMLQHLNLMKGERITNAAILLFGKCPQRFFITSEVRCAHFHGINKVKPIPSYQVYKGDVFKMIEQAVDFVLSKINLYVGDRSKKIHVDVEYEIPKQAITEAIVNAVCHRDYTSNGSVQVMLFADRFEVSNPGNLPHELTVEQLYTTHRSMPANPLIAEAMYLRGTIERMGTGTEEMTRQCLEKGLGKPEFIPEHGFQAIIRRSIRVAPQVGPILNNMVSAPNDAIKDGLFTEWQSTGPNNVLTTPEEGPNNVLITSEEGPNKITENQRRIMEAIFENQYATHEKLSEIVGISARKIRENIAKLKTQGLLERVGPNKGGYWKIKSK